MEYNLHMTEAKILTSQELLGRVNELKAELEGCENLEGLRQIKDKIELSGGSLKASEEDAKLSFGIKVGLPIVAMSAVTGGVFGYYVVSDMIRDGFEYFIRSSAPSIEPRLVAGAVENAIREKAGDTNFMSTLWGTAIPAVIGAAAAYKVYEVIEYFHVRSGYEWIGGKFKKLHDSCTQRMRDLYGI